ncbi:mitochondrial carrier [Sistotremastrum niveocremeum HHB9708]|uniref:Mitochondrial glycine transporter n=2 Tax=Sistotremastraceae TaxID=3402574 RepID=A0A164VD51_9AGAM|nr:mitochondrial carrier [Sistotremastrum niveocremeum HHB9708]KZT33851.1 mitochondrial carrier [Sistotremastrum suecicum HHB10207 ss-3]
MSLGQHLTSGAISGFTSAIALQPFDLLKTRLQQSDDHVRGRAPRNVFQVTKEILAKDGPLGLWRGTVPTLMRNVPGIAVYFSTLQKIRGVMSRTTYFSIPQTSRSTTTLPTISSQGNLIAGATTRVVIGIILNPFSVLKARFESGLYAYSGIGSALVSVYKAGPRELFKGAGASALRDAPYAGLFLYTYEAFKHDIPFLNELPSTLQHVIAASSAGTIATMATQPFDVLKTKIQVRQEQRYSSIQKAATAVWKQRGPLGFFDGASLRLSRKVASSAVAWAMYEGVLLFLKNQEDAKKLV